ncbi:MAG: hypothetical protein KatS3mg034_1057 [Vicingaceae bacterium]|nr:MAG: hypothetical protein KatS3mg034_1057 [Vicingaceae bacterium]
MNKKLLLGLIAVVALGSCTIQKRQYMSGYHVEWHKQIAKKSKKIDEHYSPKSAIQKNDDQLLVNEGNSEELNMREETNHVMAQVGETKKVISSNEKNQKDKLITNVFEEQSNPVTKRELKQQKETVKDFRKEIKNLIKNERKKGADQEKLYLRLSILSFIFGLAGMIIGIAMSIFIISVLSYLFFVASVFFLYLWFKEVTS